MRPFSLKTLYWLIGCAVAAGCVLLASTLIINSLDAYRRYHAGAHELSRFNLALIAANTVSAERGPANSVMGADAERMPALAAALAAKRRITDQSLDALERSFRSELAEQRERDDLARQLRRQLQDGRDAVDAVAALPPEQRGVWYVRDAIEQMFAAADVAAMVRDDLGRAIVKVYPQISSEIILSSAGSSMREHAGRLGSYVVMMLASPEAFDVDLHHRLMSTEGRLAQLRGLLAAYSAAVLGSSSIQATLADVDRAYFNEALPFARQVAHGIRVGTRMTLADFTQKYVPGMTPVETLRDLVSAASRERIAAARDDARRTLVSSVVLTLLVCVVLILAVLASHMLLFRPLMQAREQIVAIAQDDLHAPDVQGPMSTEMREVFDGLEVLREQQRHKRILEKNQERIAVRLKRLSETDGLTGLLNRRALEVLGWKSFAEAERDGRQLSVIMFDIDHFKSVNDTYGHATGDVVLKSVADLIQARLRPGDQLARFGGEEFIVLVPDEEENRVRLIAERLRAAVARATFVGHPALGVTASFGVASRLNGDNWGAMVARADRRLYAAKRLGRNRVCAVDEELRRSA